jgi:hypothetical protein
MQVADLLGANQLADPDHLVEGQTITIPVIAIAQLTVAPDPGTSATGLKFSLTGARPGELVTFSVITYGNTFTGQAHEADSNGAVSATYDPGSTKGTFLITATGTRGTTARATFVVENGTSPSS